MNRRYDWSRDPGRVRRSLRGLEKRVTCEFCLLSFGARGIANHRKHCVARPQRGGRP